MLTDPADHLTPGATYVDWGLERLRYDMPDQAIEVTLSGPARRNHWALRALFRRVVYLRIYTAWDVPLWRGWESTDPVNYFSEQSSLAEVQPHLRSMWAGTVLSLAIGDGSEIAGQDIAPLDVALRAFVLATNSITVQWLCAGVEVWSRTEPDEDSG